MAGKISLPIVEDQKRAPAPSRPPRRHRTVALFLILTIVLYCLYGGNYTATHVNRFAQSPVGGAGISLELLSPGKPQLGLHGTALATPAAAAATAAVNRNLVPLEAHIMSKCPDAKDCLKELVLPAMMRVYDKVNFTLSYIGTPTENDGVECKHGPNECMGNILELCAAKLYPDPKIYLGFTMCITREYKLIPQRELIEDCALEHGISFEKLNDCAVQDDGALGMGMLRSSVQRSAGAGVTKSCTVRLDEQIYCIRDDGEWVDCPSGAGVNDLVIAVEKLYLKS